MKLRFTITTKLGQLAFDDEAIRVTAPSLPGHAYCAAYYKIPETCQAVVVADQVAEVEVA